MTVPIWRNPEVTGWGRLPMHALTHADRLSSGVPDRP